MDILALRKYLKDVNLIDNLCIVGGEPSLNVLGMLNATEIIRSQGIRLRGAAIITNGIDLKEEFFKAAQYLFYTSENPTICKLLLSLSPWHVASRLELGLSQPWPEKLMFGMEDLKCTVDWGTELPKGVCAEGRGKFIKGAKNFKEETTYINVFGEEFDSATYSYETQNRIKKERTCRTRKSLMYS